ncbi:MAG: hypothetical protein LUF29_02475 [Oscillospiraceae bacterium]|nr:hypothetical protein [Oscillospiraceae bacterium]
MVGKKIIGIGVPMIFCLDDKWKQMILPDVALDRVEKLFLFLERTWRFPKKSSLPAKNALLSGYIILYNRGNNRAVAEL